MSSTTVAEEELTAMAGAAAKRGLAAGLEQLILGLAGPLGAGKTTFARGFLRSLGHSGRVPSPTYTLLEPYEFAWGRVLHLDLYRLAGDAEMEALGLSDWLTVGSVWILVEWPDRAPRLASQLDLRVELGMAGGRRRLTWTPQTPVGGILVGN